MLILDMPLRGGDGGVFGRELGGGFGDGYGTGHGGVYEEGGEMGYAGGVGVAAGATMTGSRLSDLRSPPGCSRYTSNSSGVNLNGTLIRAEVPNFAGAGHSGRPVGVFEDENIGPTARPMAGARVSHVHRPPRLSINAASLENFRLDDNFACEEPVKFGGGTFYAAAAPSHGDCGAKFDGGPVPAAAARIGFGATIHGASVSATAAAVAAAADGAAGWGATSASTGLSGLDRKIATAEATTMSAAAAACAASTTAKGNSGTINNERVAGDGCGTTSALTDPSGIDGKAVAESVRIYFPAATVSAAAATGSSSVVNGGRSGKGNATGCLIAAVEEGESSLVKFVNNNTTGVEESKLSRNNGSAIAVAGRDATLARVDEEILLLPNFGNSNRLNAAGGIGMGVGLSKRGYKLPPHLRATACDVFTPSSLRDPNVLGDGQDPELLGDGGEEGALKRASSGFDNGLGGGGGDGVGGGGLSLSLDFGVGVGVGVCGGGGGDGVCANGDVSVRGGGGKGAGGPCDDGAREFAATGGGKASPATHNGFVDGKATAYSGSAGGDFGGGSGGGGGGGGGDVSKPDTSLLTGLKELPPKFHREGSELADGPAQEARETVERDGEERAGGRREASSEPKVSDAFDMPPLDYSYAWNARSQEAAAVLRNSSLAATAAVQPPPSNVNVSGHLEVLPGGCGDVFSRSDEDLCQVRTWVEGRGHVSGGKHLAIARFLQSKNGQ